MINDQQQRQQALDPTQSFIVQAPAGSGKTELLTQRFLNLLISVEQNPEEVLAITFTRKAANEMRQRILSALHLGLEDEPSEAHKKTTWLIAQKVLQRSEKSQWHLLNNPNRLRIQTIDSLCSYLSKHLPILSQLGSNFSICEDANHYYQQAATTLIDSLENDSPWKEALAEILLHLDNNIPSVTALLSSMLAHRDQWLPHIIAAKHQPETLRAQLENNLQQLIDDSLQQLSELIPTQHIPSLNQLLEYSLASELPDEATSYWQSVANFCLTQKHEWRRTLTKNNGFPTEAKVSAEKKRLQALKAEALKLLSQLQTIPGLRDALSNCLRLPPREYDESQWRILQNLMALLPILAAQLNVIFSQQGEVDFVEVTQRALQALEADNAPTDLALCLDYQLKHILVDEFQDTSATQFRLLELLTRDWQNNDGRSLFLVGDPMQSIYRFRAAEVGLFLQAKQHGLGELQLTSLTLSSNFRSIESIVRWCNQTFAQAFPKQADIALGAIPYSPATAVHSDTSPALHYHDTLTETDNAEAQTIIQLLRQQPEMQTAILVKSRRHLLEIIPALKQAEIAFQAIDIEPLAHLPFIQDLTALTQALLHYGERTAWLAILRAPWCGLTLNDLHKLTYRDSQATIWQLLQDDNICQQLTSDGKRRVQKFTAIMAQQLKHYGHFNLSDWVQATWQALGGPATLRKQDSLEDVQAYFKLLADVQRGGQLDDFTAFQEKLNKLYAEPIAGNSQLQIMTIHKSKGLEFDRVIIPRLQAASQQDKTQLLLWQEQPSPEGLQLLLAPIKARGETNDAIYDYIRHYQQQKSFYETTRLFYVAVTRAKREIHLLADIKDNKPRANSFLPMVAQYSFTQHTSLIKEENQEHHLSPLRRLPLDYQPPTFLTHTLTTQTVPQGNNLPIWQDQNLRLTGIIIHSLLQQASQQPREQWASIFTEPSRIKALCHHLGITDRSLAENKIAQLYQQLCQSETAQWILNDQHQASASELTLQHKGRDYIIDRTFIDNGVRWIIDYKTAVPEAKETKAAFLARQATLHQAQLARYGQIMRLQTDLPVQLMLYFPLIDLAYELTMDTKEHASHF